jgi:hypothetical protein
MPRWSGQDHVWQGTARPICRARQAAGLRPVLTRGHVDHDGTPAWAQRRHPPRSPADGHEWWEHVFADVIGGPPTRSNGHVTCTIPGPAAILITFSTRGEEQTMCARRRPIGGSSPRGGTPRTHSSSCMLRPAPVRLVRTGVPRRRDGILTPVEHVRHPSHGAPVPHGDRKLPSCMEPLDL